MGRIGTDIIVFVVGLIGKRNDEENAKEKLYTYVSHVPTTSFKVRIALSTCCVAQCADICVGQGLETTIVE